MHDTKARLLPLIAYLSGCAYLLQHDDNEYGSKVAADGSHHGGPFHVDVSPQMRIEDLRILIQVSNICVLCNCRQDFDQSGSNQLRCTFHPVLSMYASMENCFTCSNLLVLAPAGLRYWQQHLS